MFDMTDLDIVDATGRFLIIEFTAVADLGGALYEDTTLVLDDFDAVASVVPPVIITEYTLNNVDIRIVDDLRDPMVLSLRQLERTPNPAYPGPSQDEYIFEQNSYDVFVGDTFFIGLYVDENPGHLSFAVDVEFDHTLMTLVPGGFIPTLHGGQTFEHYLVAPGVLRVMFNMPASMVEVDATGRFLIIEFVAVDTLGGPAFVQTPLVLDNFDAVASVLPPRIITNYELNNVTVTIVEEIANVLFYDGAERLHQATVDPLVGYVLPATAWAFEQPARDNVDVTAEQTHQSFHWAFYILSWQLEDGRVITEETVILADMLDDNGNLVIHADWERVLFGDVNRSGNVSIFDLALLQAYSLDVDFDICLLAADVSMTGQGETNDNWTADITILIRHFLHVVETLGGPTPVATP